MSCHLADGFDFPVGKPDAKGYFIYRGFTPVAHLGEDWNGNGGGNTDMGDPIYTMGRGVVVQAEDVRRGWGNVVIIRHAYRDKTGAIKEIDSLYGHLQRMDVALHDIVERGQQIGTMGAGPNNMYYAHLHFEIRKNLRIGMNRTKFAKDYSNYYSPRHFINDHRSLEASFRPYAIKVGTFDPYDASAADIAPPPDETRRRLRIPFLTEGGEEGEDLADEAERRVREIVEENAPEVADEVDALWRRLRERLGE